MIVWMSWRAVKGKNFSMMLIGSCFKGRINESLGGVSFFFFFVLAENLA